MSQTNYTIQVDAINAHYERVQSEYHQQIEALKEEVCQRERRMRSRNKLIDNLSAKFKMNNSTFSVRATFHRWRSQLHINRLRTLNMRLAGSIWTRKMITKIYNAWRRNWYRQSSRKQEVT
jgi:hypothetical protein